MATSSTDPAVLPTNASQIPNAKHERTVSTLSGGSGNGAGGPASASGSGANGNGNGNANGAGGDAGNEGGGSGGLEGVDGGGVKRVAYYYDPDVGNFSYGAGHPMKPHRMRMTHNLVGNYGMLDEVEVYRPTRATKSQLTRFHTDEYIDLLEKVMPETVEELTGGGVRCLTGDDCPAFEGVFEFCSISAGGSIGAAERLNEGSCDIAINWAGGLHHAKKTEASGFCYVNDIVLGILELLRHHPRVLYIDVDIHHGDGVEEAFYATDRVLTCSFHKFGDYFPGTGDVKDTGIKGGKNYAVNIPLRDGINDTSFSSIFRPVIQHIMDWYQPTAIVLQCGADSLAGDKLGCFNLSLDGHGACAEFVKSFGVPTMMLGGGGYTTKNVARAWTNETAVMIGRKLDENLPYNHYMDYYGPRYKMEVPSNNMDDYNTREYLDSILRRVTDNLRDMPFAPSAQIGPVPGVSVGTAIGLGNSLRKSEQDVDFELDGRIDDIIRLRKGADALSDDGMDIDSDDGSASFARSTNSRSKRQGGKGMSSMKGGKQAGGKAGSTRKNGGSSKQAILDGGYDGNPFDVISELRATVPGLSGSVQGGPRKKRAYFHNPGLPPIIPGFGKGGFAPLGKANHHQAIKLSAVRIADGMDGVSRSRVGSPVA